MHMDIMTTFCEYLYYWSCDFSSYFTDSNHSVSLSTIFITDTNHNLYVLTWKILFVVRCKIRPLGSYSPERQLSCPPPPPRTTALSQASTHPLA
ncbi:hypothetical protein BDY19DRAFT_972393 [Irpex rosettiformis]|uniref:Uncharacterized protein n=1 Tax=Irpex rosettiformis TaxID=378272 RepID=A0ACB8TQP4_9APHY|nr:hypothetical protein BDY19DRAFT_972393 [Irpex rosettiformis]